MSIYFKLKENITGLPKGCAYCYMRNVCHVNATLAETRHKDCPLQEMPDREEAITRIYDYLVYAFSDKDADFDEEKYKTLAGAIIERLGFGKEG